MLAPGRGLAGGVDAGREPDRRISNRDFDLVIEGVDLLDTRDGRIAYTGPGRRRQVFPAVGGDQPGDQHTLSFGSMRRVLIRNCDIRADRIEEALKLSASHDIVVDNCRLEGGGEDALDIVRGSGYVFRNVTFVARGGRAATVKGGARRVDFINCRFTGTPSEGHFVELGNWSDYDILERPETTEIRIDDATRFASGRTDAPPYAVQILYAQPPAMQGEFVTIPRVFIDLYFAFKRMTERERVLRCYSRENLCWNLEPCNID